MQAPPEPLEITLAPRARHELIDLEDYLLAGPQLRGARGLLLVSHHTTAGFLDPGTAWRLGPDRRRIHAWLEPFRLAFPARAAYAHDALHLRGELTPEQRETEPLNGDSHLTFILAGLQPCLTLGTGSRAAPFLVELDGTDGTQRRSRTVTVLPHAGEELVETIELTVGPRVPRFDAIALTGPEVGLTERLEDCLHRHGVGHARIELRLGDERGAAGLTVNEHEPLLMEADLASVLQDPAVFARSSMRAASGATRLSATTAKPAGEGWRLPRSVSIAALDRGDGSGSRPLLGRYQSPVLVRWGRPRDCRLIASVHRLRSPS